MATIELPIRNDIPAYKFQTVIETKIYFFTFRYNGRMARWIMDLADQDETPIVTGIPIQLDYDLLRTFLYNPLVPQGFMVALDESGTGIEPDRFNFGDDIKLFYVESTDPL